MKSSPNHLKICTWNSRGLVASVPFLRALCEQNDLVCITEHWLHQNRLRKLGDIAIDIDFIGRASRHAPSDKYGCHKGQGGVAIFWKRKFNSITPLRQLIHDRVCAVRLQGENNSITNIFCVYLPARGCVDDFHATLDELGSFIENMESGSYNIICGDLNADVGSLGGERSEKIADKRGRTLDTFIKYHNLYPVNLMESASGPINTHYGPTGESCIDYILIPQCFKENVRPCRTGGYDPINTSDHKPVYVDIEVGEFPCGATEGFLPCKLRWDKMSPQALFSKYQYPIGQDLDRLFFRNVGANPGAEDVDAFMKEIVDIIKEHEKSVPMTKFKSNIKPFRNYTI